jgi:hypothetical protein
MLRMESHRSAEISGRNLSVRGNLLHQMCVNPPDNDQQDHEDNDSSQPSAATAIYVSGTRIGFVRLGGIAFGDIDYAMNGHALDRGFPFGGGFTFSLEFQGHSSAGYAVLADDLKFHAIDRLMGAAIEELF